MDQHEHMENVDEGILPVVRKINALWVVRQEIDAYPQHFLHTEQDVDYHVQRYLHKGSLAPEEQLEARDRVVEYQLDSLVPFFRQDALVPHTGSLEFNRVGWQRLEMHMGKNYQLEMQKEPLDKYMQGRLVLDEAAALAITKLGLFDRIGEKTLDFDLSMAVSYLAEDIKDDSSRSMYNFHKVIEERTTEFRETYSREAYGSTFDRKTWWSRARQQVAQALQTPKTHSENKILG